MNQAQNNFNTQGNNGIPNNQNFNSEPPKKMNLVLITGIISIIAICVILIVIFSNYLKNNTNIIDENVIEKEVSFDNNVILEHLTVNDVKVSELNTIDDFINKVNAEIWSVGICYKETEVKEGCRSINYNDFVNQNYDKNGISSLGFYMYIKSNQNIETKLTIQFWTYPDIYNVYKNKSKYFSLDFISSNDMVMLDNIYLENITLDEI